MFINTVVRLYNQVLEITFPFVDVDLVNSSPTLGI